MLLYFYKNKFKIVTILDVSYVFDCIFFSVLGVKVSQDGQRGAHYRAQLTEAKHKASTQTNTKTKAHTHRQKRRTDKHNKHIKDTNSDF